jgi:hypothetical protein
MDKYYYLFSNGNSKPIDIKINEEVEGYVTFNGGEPVDWTQYDYIGGVLVPISIVPPPVPPQPTKIELTNRALDVVNDEYSALLSKLAYIYIKPDLAITNSPTEVAANKAAIATEFRTAQAELLTKQGVILNG